MYDEAAETETSNIGESFLLTDSTSLEILDLSGSTRVTGSISSKASHLQEITLDGCEGLGDVMLPNNSWLRSFSFDGCGPSEASHWASTIELPPPMSRPNQAPIDANKKKGVVKTSIISLQGCGRLDKLFLRGLPNLVELDLSGCAIKVLDFRSTVVDVPMLKRLFMIGCERLCAIKWGSDDDEKVPQKLQMIYVDTLPRSRRVSRPPSLDVEQKSFQLQINASTTDARFARSLFAPIDQAYSSTYYFNIRIISSAACRITTGAILQPAARASNKTMMAGSSSDQQRQHYCLAGGVLMYGDVFTKVGDIPAMTQAFPQAPMEQSDRHIEIGGESRSLQREAEDPDANNLASLMRFYTESVHVHDVSTCSNIMSSMHWYSLRLCRIERCPRLQAIFPPGALDHAGRLEIMGDSDLLMARCVWSKGGFSYNLDHLKSLRHLHLRCCPSLHLALAMCRRPSLPHLETLYIIHCGNLRHVFVPDDEKIQHSSIEFPKLMTIHLHDLPALQQICEGTKMMAPALETINIRGCWSLRSLPALLGRKPGMKKPAVEVEKDVWDVLQWDGVDASHHPSLYEAPVHSRFYKRCMLRRTVLR
nr:unnamed protein product [Digitaria exilis]